MGAANKDKDMTKHVTFLATCKLAAGVTEAQMLAASERFQDEFVKHEPGVLRRELIRKSEGHYIDIVLFRSEEDLAEVIEKEKSSEVCGAFFVLMDMSDLDEAEMGPFESLAVYE